MFYINPWHDPRNTHSRSSFETDAKPLEYKGFQIIKWHDHEYHLLKDGKLVSMLAGPNGAKAKADELLKMPSVTILKQAIKDFTTVSDNKMTQQEMFDFLQEQLTEMRREPENHKALSSILGA